MRKNRSPWIAELSKARRHRKLHADIKTDVAIVGAGIAGISTAFFLLKHTSKKVIILEKFKLAHGATGHNAGQVVSYFEYGYKHLVDTFGPTLAAEGQHAVEMAWTLLDEMYTDAKLDIPFSRFLGHEGLSTYTQLEHALENAYLKRETGLKPDRITVALTAPYLNDIPKKYDGLWSAIPHPQMLEMLETKNPKYVAMASEQKGVVNSALLCERVVEYLQAEYPDRFTLYEHAPVNKLILRKDTALLDVETRTVLAKRVVLCTNGFENLHIVNENGLEVDAKYHALVRGSIGYMSAYMEPLDKPPSALSYFNEGDDTPDANYIYVTRRPYDFEEGVSQNLICIGGPEHKLDDQEVYRHEEEYPERAMKEIDEFVNEVYEREPHESMRYAFTWHGLMGYTRNGVRMVGPEPKNNVLLYNLGCNGVGILPSLMGARKIARHVAGETVPRSIFDVPERLVPSAVPVSEKVA